MQTKIIKIGESGTAKMPFSEVCMHMKIADKIMDFVIVGTKHPMVQLKKDGENFSFPICLSEAGVRYNEDNQLYYHPNE